MLVLARWEPYFDPLISSNRCWRKPGNDYTLGCLDLRTLDEAGPSTSRGFGLFCYNRVPTGYTEAADVRNVGNREYVRIGDDPLARMTVANRNRLADVLGIPRTVLSDATLGQIIGEQIRGTLADPAGATRPKPWQMNRRGLTVGLKGYGDIYRHRLDRAHPVFDKTLAVRRLDYERLRDRGVPLDLLRKKTGWDMRALGITDEAELLPTRFVRDGYLAPETTWTEGWPTDSSTLSSGQDEPWTELVGDLSVASGVVGLVSVNTISAAACDTVVSSDDHQHDATAVNPDVAGAWQALLCRFDGAVTGDVPDNCYSLFNHRGHATNKNLLDKIVSASITNLDSSSTDAGSPVTMTITTNGTAISGSNGAVALSASDSDITGEVLAGIRMRLDGSGVHADVTLDGHTFADLGGSATAAIRRRR